MNKRLVSILISTVMAVSVLAGCGTTGNSSGASPEEYPAADDPEVVLTMAEVNPEDTIVGRMDQKFCEEVERLSGGSVKIKLQASGIMGDEQTVLDSMFSDKNEIDIARISALALTDYGCSKAALLSLPYAFVSREHFWNFADSDLAQDFLNEPEELGLGIKGLFYGEEGFRHFFAVNPVTGIDDLKGLKLRASSDLLKGLIEELGAEVVDVDFTELYSALQTGLVDGAEQPIVNYQSNSFEKVAPNLILDGHTLGIIEVIITDDALSRLTDDQKAALEEAGRTASSYIREMSAGEEEQVLGELKDDGINVVEVEDKTPWQEASKRIIDEKAGENSDLYEQILGMQ